MKRRAFCGSALATLATASLPLGRLLGAGGCASRGRRPGSFMETAKRDLTTPALTSRTCRARLARPAGYWRVMRLLRTGAQSVEWQLQPSAGTHRAVRRMLRMSSRRSISGRAHELLSVGARRRATASRDNPCEGGLMIRSRPDERRPRRSDRTARSRGRRRSARRF